ncbi:hypothetical protein LIER_16117 [Lithospermum erythrorhizon]|uniref:Uncharacterized protein n=1 Tax=Lithospermum erythrorhizon TaxID=34254 RepID=A0AAV3Q5D5_LITER
MLVDTGTELDVTVGKGSRMFTVRASFTVVDLANPSYNGLIGRPLLTALRAIVSPLHLKMKFPTPGGVGEMTGDQKRGSKCYQLSIPRGLSKNDPPKRKRHEERYPGVMNIGETTKSERQDNDPKDSEIHKKGMPHEDLELVAVDNRRPDRVFRISTRLGEDHREALRALIKKYEEVFSWGPEDMPGMDKEKALHKMHVDPSFKLVKQKKINFSNDKNRAIQKEVEELVATKAIRELQFPKWITNVGVSPDSLG